MIKSIFFMIKSIFSMVNPRLFSKTSRDVRHRTWPPEDVVSRAMTLEIREGTWCGTEQGRRKRSAQRLLRENRYSWAGPAMEKLGQMVGKSW